MTMKQIAAQVSTAPSKNTSSDPVKASYHAVKNFLAAERKRLPPYRLTKINGIKGMGMVATRDMAVGDCVLTEEPVFSSLKSACGGNVIGVGGDYGVTISMSSSVWEATR